LWVVNNSPISLQFLGQSHARRAKLFDRCAPADGIVPFDALIEQFMSVEPYSKARRVFVIVDNGSAHRGREVDLGLVCEHECEGESM
jgi:hypothetical protein